MFDTVWWSTRTDVPLPTMLVLIAGESFTAFLTVLTVNFLGFHIWLMAKAMTTVEFCEKSRRPSYNSNLYSVGLYKNICAVLGPQPALWLVPISMPAGDGMSWHGAVKDTAAEKVAKSSLRSALLPQDGVGSTGASTVAIPGDQLYQPAPKF